jgi:hypothetical protein
MLFNAGKLTAQEYTNQIKAVDAAYEPQIKESQVNKNNRAGTGAGKSGSGTKDRYPIYNDKNELVGHAYSRDEAIRETEKLGGKYPFADSERETTSETTDPKTGLKTVTTSKSTTKHAGGTPSDRKSKYKRGGDNGSSGSTDEKVPLS